MSLLKNFPRLCRICEQETQKGHWSKKVSYFCFKNPRKSQRISFGGKHIHVHAFPLSVSNHVVELSQSGHDYNLSLLLYVTIRIRITWCYMTPRFMKLISVIASIPLACVWHYFMNATGIVLICLHWYFTVCFVYLTLPLKGSCCVNRMVVLLTN